MLRKRLIMRLGFLVLGFVAGAAVAIALLQGVLRDLNDLNDRAERMMDSLHEATVLASSVESSVHDAALGAVERLDGLEAIAGKTEHAMSDFRRRADSFGSEVAQAADRATALAAEIRVAASGAVPVGTVQSDLAPRAEELSRLTQSLDQLTRQAAAASQSQLSVRLKVLIVSLTIAALIMTNVSIVVLVRTASMILRPVEQLLEGSRQLSRERFEYRISRRSGDGEFDELAGAYNTLAEQLASNEQKKIVALRQLAVTLNHELNNIINAIELQLQVVDRRAGYDPLLKARFAEIHEHLERMARTIASLRQVRRIVLTDYSPGEAMLDLPRSIAADEIAVAMRPSAVPPPPTPV